MRKQTAKLLKLIEEARVRNELIDRNVHVRLDVTTFNDEDPAIRFYLSTQEDPKIKADGCLRLYFHNPLFFKRAVRRAETIATEAWGYYASQGYKATVSHYGTPRLWA